MFHIPGPNNIISNALPCHLPLTAMALLPSLQIHHFQPPHITMHIAPQKSRQPTCTAWSCKQLISKHAITLGYTLDTSVKDSGFSPNPYSSHFLFISIYSSQFLFMGALQLARVCCDFCNYIFHRSVTL